VSQRKGNAYKSIESNYAFGVNPSPVKRHHDLQFLAVRVKYQDGKKMEIVAAKKKPEARGKKHFILASNF